MADARLTESEVDKIVNLLTTWQGRLSWELLLRRVTPMLRRDFTRQGLDKQATISIAFKQAKERLRTRAKKPTADRDGLPPELAAALSRNDNLVAEVDLLKAERDRFLERFATWLYNARSRGISEHDLNQPLPPVDRDKSERGKSDRNGKGQKR
ncbi:hypothetical protein ELG67_11080 [Rhizobium leguminosarum]|uniref:hypothetical protein n=1 Tax=Rhizobium leguminosarum TaxID=384 RepID=UPI001037AA80|nr:hypothetical protein [Rhizobium leguminosarum]TBG89593.1 hypothetical protein ELG67_11080 [Rhizobium leguminosarum]